MSNLFFSEIEYPIVDRSAKTSLAKQWDMMHMTKPHLRRILLGYTSELLDYKCIEIWAESGNRKSSK